MKGDPLVQSKNFKKSRRKKVPKKVGLRIFSVFSRLWTSVLFFLFVLDELLRFELLRFEVIEQMNKKVELSCLKKATHCNSRAHFLLKCAD